MIYVLTPNVIAENKLRIPHLKIWLKEMDLGKKCKKTFDGNRTALKTIIKLAITAIAPVVGMALAAKSKNPGADQATISILKSISGGKVLSLTDIHGKNLRLKIM